MSARFDGRVIGSILLIAGTSIGAGMLALPVINAAAGFVYSTIFLVLVWLMMTLGALFLLEVNLSLPVGCNMVSMAKATLGRFGELVAWIAYLLLLYSLVAAYISGGSDILQDFIRDLGWQTPQWASAVLLTTLLALIVYRGIRSVDYVNRALIFGKITAYLFLICVIAPQVTARHLQGGQLSDISIALMVLVTSFGYATIVPSLRSYFGNDIKKMRMVVLVGSMMPLLIYIVWDAMVMGVIPRVGTGTSKGLVAIAGSDNVNSELTYAVGHVLNDRYGLTEFFRFFSIAAILTSFLGVALCLTDFLADGLKKSKKGKSGLVVSAATFLPPLFLVFFYPGAFIIALSYAGVLCLILLLLLPVLMAWSARYIKHMPLTYQMFGGKTLLILLSVLAVGLTIFGLLENLRF